MERLATVDPRGLRWRHFTLGEMDSAQLWLLHVRHESDHLEQLRDVKAARDSPRREGHPPEPAAGGRRGRQAPGEGSALRARHPASTVLVIRDNELLTSDAVVGGDDVLEVRPVMSGGSGDRGEVPQVRGRRALELRRHNAAFCSPHFIEFFRKQVAEAVHRHHMFTPEETIMVAVSGGKDSLALWDVLIEDGYQTAGLYLDLGIFDYSEGVAGQVRGVRGGPRARRCTSSGWPTRWAPRSRWCSRRRAGRPARPAASPSAT